MTPITTKDLAKDIEAFLEFKRALGYQYRRAEFMLRNFERFVQQHRLHPAKVTLEAMVSDWLSRIDGRKPVTVALELGVIRQLCLYRRRHDPRGFVPTRAWAPQTVESKFLPYVFSRKEVRRILDAAEKHRGKNIGSTMLRTLVLVLYCTGLRIGEAVRLQLQDVDFKREMFTIRESKGKTRIVPFRSDLARELNRYIGQRQCIVNTADNQALFVRLNGQSLTVNVASTAIRRLLRRLGLKSLKGRVGPSSL